jgi:hypothetical protein
MDRHSLDTFKNERLRSEEDLAQMVVRVAQAAPAHAIICATETGAFATQVHGLSQQVRVIAATTNAETYDALTKKGLETILLPIRAIDRHNQVRHMLSVALRSQQISVGDLVLCALGRNVYRKAEGDLVVLGDVEAGIEYLAVSDLLKLTDGIRPSVLEVAITVAARLAKSPAAERTSGRLLCWAIRLRF